MRVSFELRLPRDEAAERAVIGSALIDPECFTAAAEHVHASDFYEPRNMEIWRAMKQLAEAGSAIDRLLVRSQLLASGKLENVGGDEYLGSLLETIPTSENATLVAKRVRELSLVRQVQHVALKLAQEGSEPMFDVPDYLDRAGSVLASISDQRSGGLPVTALADALHESYTILGQRVDRGQALIGHATGFVELDYAISGFAPGDLIVLAARPGMGKTALANDLKIGIARSTTRNVLSLELEMTREQLVHRVLSGESGIELRRIRSARLNANDLRDLAKAADELSKLRVYFIDRRNTRISELRAAARKLARVHGRLGLIVVDYLQIARAEQRQSQREREVAEISAALKSLAGELSCPVLALSQLNRSVESRADKRPMLSDLRESGAIEQDADTVLFLYRDEHYNPQTTERGIAELIVGKQRSGPIGTVRLRWVAELTRFESLSKHERQGNFAHSGNGHGGFDFEQSQGRD